jgi:ABC-type transport system involved in cytochrome bd biosynthesis fused ATPase/permease subunit
LKRANLVAVFDSGRLTQFGSPSQLAKEKGFYAEVARMQALSESSEKEGREEQAITKERL